MVERLIRTNLHEKGNVHKLDRPEPQVKVSDYFHRYLSFV